MEPHDKTCKGNEISRIVLTDDHNKSIEISVYIGDDDKIFYMCDKSLEGMHIRPKEEFISEFYNKCDNFQKLIMNRKSTPLYKAVFSVLKEMNMVSIGISRHLFSLLHSEDIILSQMIMDSVTIQKDLLI